MSDSVEVIDAVTADATSTEAPVASSTKNVSVETRTYRSYGVVVTDDKGKEVFKALGEKDANGVAKILPSPVYRQSTADGKAWKSAEDAGNLKLSENNFLFYTLENEEGFAELVPDAEQRLYILNKGLSALQTQKANQKQAELTEDETAFAYNDETIDLRDAVNESPKKKNLTGLQKISRDLDGLSEADRLKLMELLAQMQMAAING
jgi:hypothetical protein